MDISLSLLSILFILSVAQCTCIYSLKHLPKINAVFQLTPKSRTIQIICIAVTIIYFYILFLVLQQFSCPQPNPYVQPFTKYLSNEESINPNTSYRQIEHDQLANEEQYFFLYTASDNSQKKVQILATYLQHALCKRRCTINFYDNFHAYLLDRERSTIIDDTKMKNWNKQNYVFVADHFIGYLPSMQKNPFIYFPYKDAYYKSLVQ